MIICRQEGHIPMLKWLIEVDRTMQNHYHAHLRDVTDGSRPFAGEGAMRPFPHPSAKPHRVVSAPLSFPDSSVGRATDC